jgi:MFS family permease
MASPRGVDYPGMSIAHGERVLTLMENKTLDGRLPIGQVLAVTTTTQALTTVGALALAAVAPKAAADLAISPALIGYQVAVVYLGAMLSAPIGGGLVRRFGATRTSQLALWLVAAGCALSALGTLASLAGGAFVMGLGYGGTNPAASHLLSRSPIARNMNLIFPIKQSGVPIGGVLTGIVVPPLTMALSWQAALVICALALLAFSIAIESRRRTWDADREPGAPILASPFASVRLVWRNPVLRWLALSSFVYSAVQLCLTGFLVTYLVTEVGFELVLAGSVLAITHGAGAAGRLAWGWLADRLRSGTLAMIALGILGVVGALATAAIDSGWPAWLVAAATALFGFCAMGWNGVFIAIIARQSPQRIGMATGGSLAVTYAGVVTGPAAFSVMHNYLGVSYGGGFAVLALVTVAGIACVLVSRLHWLRAAAAR